MENFLRFRKEYPVFEYKAYHITDKPDSIDISYDFEISGLAEFHPGWSFPKPSDSCVRADSPAMERLVFSLGMAEAVSCWKAVCSPEFQVRCGKLDDGQILWWKKLYFLGLGEFFYRNKISTDMDSFVNIYSSGKSFAYESDEAFSAGGCLIPIGGGKDSALTLETLKNAGMDCMCYAINKRSSITGTVLAAGLDENRLITAQRRFDRTVVRLNNEGFLNGHTPFSSVVAFSAEIAAFIYGKKYIVLSNEASANESTVSGGTVNHQYSKSFEFEKDFHDYEEKYLRTGSFYFSFLRPLSEFQIAAMFVKHKKYLPVFRSCNLGSKVSPDIWCAECPKCLFVCLILSPFLSPEELEGIFGKYLPDDTAMLDWFRELIGKSEHKPFECVGSVSEVRLAVSMTIKEMLDRGERLPLLFDDFIAQGLYKPEIISSTLNKYFSYYNSENLLPEEFSTILKNEMERLL